MTATDRTSPARLAGLLRTVLAPVLLVVVVALGGCAPAPATAPAAAPAPVTSTAPAATTSAGPTSTAQTTTTAPTDAAEEAEPVAEAEPSTEAEPTTEAEAVAEPRTVSIPAIGVQADLVGVGLEPDGQMQTPDFGLAGWYTEGPRPGDPGPAVVVAHVDSYEGPDVFFRLRELTAGDEIAVGRADGTSGTWTVQRSEQTDKDALPTASIWNDTDEPVLRLITCGGAFDREARSYEENVVVYATPST